MYSGDKITVGAPYFNKTFLPIFGIVMLLTGFGPFLSWKRARMGDALKKSAWCLAVTVTITASIALVMQLDHMVGIFASGIAVWLAVTTLWDMGRRAGLPKASLSTAVGRLIGLPPSTWAMYVGHMGIAVVAAGVIAISVWRVEIIQVQKIGEPTQVGAYEYTLQGVLNARGPNYQTSVAEVEVTRNGAHVITVYPERRFYPVEGQPTTEAGISTAWHGDFYAVLGDPSGKDAFVTRNYYNPGVPWMWFGSLLITLLGLISMADRRLRVGAPGRAKSRRKTASGSPQAAE
jgi:cytochrome c-type biogenesis protein CcmF